ncbi:GNAT family N-acetyltransferase [Aliiglaciecola lipolytica]|uniref:N-acetyltransferase domain-containing protein n=1 Tax=Aliiglaciecola lipolytica E3 TaxID=1127673 RepID=K6XTB2_9ALTE|nr:GNAT family N-acetyltransferase [Aliiglaciecola lipolytica]GAC14911.1 hypothetical protein GLIP_2284 [Aliiglaciecola lipolytica E3]
MDNTGNTEYHSERFNFVTLCEFDLNLIYELYCSDLVMEKVMPKLNHTQAKNLLFDILKQQQTRPCEFWRIECACSGETMGIQGFMASKKQRNQKCAEFGILLRPEAFGKKVATESVTAMLNYGFRTLKLESVHAFYQADNIASGKIVEKLHFSIEPVSRQPKQRRCEITRTDFFNHNKDFQFVGN